MTPLKLFDEAEDAVVCLPGLDTEALAEGLITLLNDASRRREVQAAARTRHLFGVGPEPGVGKRRKGFTPEFASGRASRTLMGRKCRFSKVLSE